VKHLLDAPLQGRLLALPTNNRLSSKANSILTLNPGTWVEKEKSTVSYGCNKVCSVFEIP